MVKEVLRWRPIVPIITPHRVIEDDWYEGMFIPRGTICLANAWHMNRDPEIFGKNGDDFDPYGFGSRICVGHHMADNSLFINIAILLWAMKIERKKDVSGGSEPLDLDGWVDVGLVVLAVFITYRHVDANMNAFADVRSRLRPRLLHASLRLLRCVSCKGYEREFILDTWGKEVEFIVFVYWTRK
jgi:cytochrome P450